MIITVTLNPAVDKTLTIPNFEIDKVNRIEEVRLDVGGKGINVSKTLGSLNVPSLAVSVLGGANGRWLKQEMDAMGIKNHVIFSEHDTRTNIKVVDPQKNTYTDINESGFYIDDFMLEKIEKELLELSSKGDIVVLSGKLPSGTDKTIYARWTRLLKKQGVKVFVDSDGIEFANCIEQVPYAIKPNKKELKNITSSPLENIEDYVLRGKELIGQGIAKVAISLGSKGAIFMDKDSSIYARGLNVDVKSTVGAGDAMMASLIYAKIKELSLAELAKTAIATSSATIMKEGTQSPDYETILSLIDRVNIEIL